LTTVEGRNALGFTAEDIAWIKVKSAEIERRIAALRTGRTG
jgi:hypothetical protein